MLGAIIGDIAGSRFEKNNVKSKDFKLFDKGCHFTDDTVMTLAIGKALLECKGDYKKLSSLAIFYMQKFGREYPNAGYGFKFYSWLRAKEPKPYNSYGNGAGMRVSDCGAFATSLDEAKLLSKLVTEVSHNHIEGLKGAEAITVAIYLAKNGKKIPEIREYISKNYYLLDFTLDEIRKDYKLDLSCQGSVPYAIETFLESNSFEDAIKNAISIGGDSDTIAAMAGGIAEAYYGIPNSIREQVVDYLDANLREILNEIENGLKIIKK